jgi:3',5'-cyclic AMP phosphodiesterase CpdA
VNTTAFGSFGHLAGRFAGSLWPGGPDVAGESWARRWLTPREQEIWARMSGPDRRHAVAVAHRAAAALGNADGAGVSRAAIVAALLHDSGKVESGFGTFARVAATLVAMGYDRERVASWAENENGLRKRFGQYVSHDQIGARILGEAGSDPLVVAWAGEHHLPPDRWTVDSAVGRILKDADDD